MSKAPRITVKIEGADELIKKLRRLGVDTSQILEAAATIGAQVLADDANARAPEPKIAMETVEAKKTSVMVDIGPLDEVWWWRFLETGAQPHTITGNPLVFEVEGDETIQTGLVQHPGMAARPFLRPAFDGKHPKATDAFGKVMKKTVEKHVE